MRALIAGGASQRFQYEHANRLVKVKADDNTTVLATYTYGSSNERVIAEEGSSRTYYACHGSVEYIESGGSTTPVWSKSYVYLGNRLLSTLTPNGSGGESVQYHHPDRLGTRLVTDPSNGTSFEQVTLPFGTALNAESTGASNRRFTTYDLSATTGLDYAVNRHYDPQQGRFTQVDPIGMNATSLGSPQTLNLYAYCGNDPVNHIDPNGLFWGKLFKWISKALKWIAIAVLVAVVIVSGPFAPATGSILGHILGFLIGLGAKIGIATNFLAGGVLLAEGATAATAALLGASGLLLASAAVGALAGQGGKTIRRQQKEIRRQERQRRARFPRVRIPGSDKPVDPNPEPPPGKPTTEPPSPPDPRPINPESPEVPGGRWARFKLGVSLVLKGISGTFTDIAVMVDPAVIAELACQEDPNSSTCRQFQIFIPPEKRCKILRNCA